MSSPISSNMGLTARSPELRHFVLAGRMNMPDVGHLRVGYFGLNRLGDEGRGR